MPRAQHKHTEKHQPIPDQHCEKQPLINCGAPTEKRALSSASTSSNPLPQSFDDPLEHGLPAHVVGLLENSVLRSPKAVGSVTSDSIVSSKMGIRNPAL